MEQRIGQIEVSVPGWHRQSEVCTILGIGAPNSVAAIAALYVTFYSVGLCIYKVRKIYAKSVIITHYAMNNQEYNAYPKTMRNYEYLNQSLKQV